MHRHPTISLWQRAEDGSYAAELNGFHLEVHWRAESTELRRGFLWSAKSPSGQKLRANEVEEEIEVAMGHAEGVAHGRLHD